MKKRLDDVYGDLVGEGECKEVSDAPQPSFIPEFIRYKYEQEKIQRRPEILVP